MKTINLTQGKVAKVDDAMYGELSNYKWFAIENRDTGTFYCRRNVVIDGRRSTISMHRHVIGACSGQMVDHINGDGLDNRKSNLRLCSASENNWNSRIRINNKSGLKGVSWCERDRVWIVGLRANGRYVRIGAFNDKEKAGKAYTVAAKKYHGEFARSMAR